MTCTHGTRLTLHCKECAEQAIYMRGVGITHGQTPYDAGELVVTAMDAGSIGQPAEISTRRAAGNALDGRRQNDVRQTIGELLVEYRNKPGMLVEEQIERVINAMLDG